MDRDGRRGLIRAALSSLALADRQADGRLLSARARHRLPLTPKWRPRSQRPSASPSLAQHKTKGKSGQNQTEKLTNIGTTNTLRKIPKDQKAHRSKEEVIPKKLQLREPIQRFSITRLALPLIRALHGFCCLSHKLGDGPELIILSCVELEITSRFFFPRAWAPQRSS
ncbi:hypothetical protein Cgig2_012832 [Carnegiea gigantea]|uniref:Uncharacterized protein n=1 Tax=Carnegiea gigantea TaxID=171969 RepID=A0A9Q1K933_9CARY|nr:hypothetical protein Cgig2_012832 [Carnegiea gigantea]